MGMRLSASAVRHKYSPTGRIRWGHRSTEAFAVDSEDDCSASHPFVRLARRSLERRFWNKASPRRGFSPRNLAPRSPYVRRAYPLSPCRPCFCNGTVFHRRASFWTPRADISFHRAVLGGVRAFYVDLPRSTGLTSPRRKALTCPHAAIFPAVHRTDSLLGWLPCCYTHHS